MTVRPRQIPFPASSRPRSGHRVFHQGELDAHRRFGIVDEAQEMSEIVIDRLTLGALRLMESLPFFFFTAASGDGSVVACDIASRLHDDSGQPLPLVHLIDAKTLMFALPQRTLADAVIGSADSWHTGLLFVDFLGRGTRYRVNGRARFRPAAISPDDLWPVPCRIVEVSIQQAYPNCTRRVVRMDLLE